MGLGQSWSPPQWPHCTCTSQRRAVCTWEISLHRQIDTLNDSMHNIICHYWDFNDKMIVKLMKEHVVYWNWQCISFEKWINAILFYSIVINLPVLALLALTDFVWLCWLWLMIVSYQFNVGINGKQSHLSVCDFNMSVAGNSRSIFWRAWWKKKDFTWRWWQFLSATPWQNTHWWGCSLAETLWPFKRNSSSRNWVACLWLGGFAICHCGLADSLSANELLADL